MIKGIAHIGIRVESLSAAIKFFKKFLNVNPSLNGEKNGTKWAIIPFGNVKIELSERTGGGAGEFKGIHHLSFAVEGIETVMKNLKNKRITFRSEKPKNGYHGEKIVFLDPSSTEGIIIELSDEGKER
jgi:methylmalonyl-CoA/ethylmalonyl-CoA epimerase